MNAPASESLGGGGNGTKYVRTSVTGSVITQGIVLGLCSLITSVSNLYLDTALHTPIGLFTNRTTLPNCPAIGGQTLQRKNYYNV